MLAPHIQKAIVCGGVPKIRDWRSLSNGELTRAERNMRFVESVCVTPEGTLIGQPIKLADFQEAFFYAVYDNEVHTETAILSIARKNSKTATIATIVILHLVGLEAIQNSEIVSGARSREQAGQIFRYASKMVQMSPKLQGLIRIVPSSKKLIGMVMNVTYHASSAEAKTAHGGSGVLVLMDEVGQISGSQDDFYDALTTGQGAYEGKALLIIISTQAPTDGDLLSVKIDDARDSQDKRIVCHVYEADADCDLEDEAQWLNANPAMDLFRSKSDIAKHAREAKRMPSAENSFRNLFLNQRVEVNAVFVSKSIWEEASGDAIIPDGSPVWIGIDLSQVLDLTSIGVLGRVDGQWNWNPFFWLPEFGIVEKSRVDRVHYDIWAKQGHINLTPSKAIDFAYPALKLREICLKYDVQKVAYDKWMFNPFKEYLINSACFDFDDEGNAMIADDVTGETKLIEFKEFRQGFITFAPALNELERDLIDGKLFHNNNPVMNMCAANAIVKTDPAGNRKLDKSRREKRIDGMVTLAMARGVAVSVDLDEIATPFDADANYRLEL